MSSESETEPESSSKKWIKILYSWIQYITVEPSMFLFMMAFMITSVVEQAFFFYKACTVDYNFSDMECDNLTDQDRIPIQITVAKFHQWNDIGSHLIPIILALFMGNWSDRRGRKILLLLGLFSKLIYSTMIVVNATQRTWNLNTVIYTATLPMAVFGADVAVFAACFAYVSDISSVSHRTLRITILDVVYLSAMPTGVQIGSYLFKNVVNRSYAIMFAINASLLVIAIIYTFLRLEWQTTPEQKPLTNKNVLSDFFDKKHVIETFKTVTKKRIGFGRLHVWLILFSMMLYVFQRDEASRMYLYTQLIFNWGVSQFSDFKTFKSCFFVIAMLLGTPLLSRVLKLKDTTIIMIGALSHAAGRIFYIYATTPLLFYAGAVVAALGPTVAPVLRSMASKSVDSIERGKMFTLLSVFDNAVPLVSGVLYSQVYNHTVKSIPGAIFWLTFSTQIMVLILISIVKFTRISPRREQIDGTVN